MKYNPGPEVENHNVSKGEHPLKDFALLAAGSLGLVALVVGGFMALGEGLTSWISEETERKILGGRSWGFDSAPWPEGQAVLAKIIGVPAADYTVSVWCESHPNAVALPGRQILVSEGLLKLISTENALAFVLGHELGHFKQRDHLRGLGRGVGLSVGLALLGMDASGSSLMELGGQVLARRHQREQESGADEIATELVRRTYGGLDGAGEFFEKMAKESGVWAGGPQFLATHPGPEDRLRRFESAVGDGAKKEPLVVGKICPRGP